MRTDNDARARRLSAGRIRAARFSRRLTGLDEQEVREFLDRVADGVAADAKAAAALLAENRRLREENARLLEENARLSAPTTERELTPRAATLLLVAQQLADTLMEDAVRRSREMLAVARAERRAMVREAERQAERTLRSTQAMSRSRDVVSTLPPSPLDHRPRRDVSRHA